MNDQLLHPDPNQLEAFARGELDASAIATIQQHLADCSSCCQALESVPDDDLLALVRRTARSGNPAADTDKGQAEAAQADTLWEVPARRADDTSSPDDAPREVASGDAASSDAASSDAASSDAASSDAASQGAVSLDAASLDIEPGNQPAGSSRDDVLPREALRREALPRELIEHARYQVASLIGKGGMGDVYKAEHRLMQRDVALKLIKSELTASPAAVERFHREVRAAARLSHPNIVTAYDAEQAGDTHFMAMEFVEGIDLAEVVGQSGRVSVEQACDYVRQAAEGLAHAHEQGMVHRDIKPHNLMLTSEGTVKILDFGLASLAERTTDEPIDSETRADLTAAGSVMGTPDYISPEQAADAHSADIRSDIYSLGATLYFLLAGQPPFAEGSVVEKLKSHAEFQATPIETRRSDVPRELAEILRRMMAKRPADRFQTPRELADALEPFANRKQTSLRRRRSMLRIGVGIAAMLLVGALAAGWFVAGEYGTLIINAPSDEQIGIVIRSGDIERLETVAGPTALRLPTGDYVLSLAVPSEDFSLDVEQLRLTRGATTPVTVRRREAADVPSVPLPELVITNSIGMKLAPIPAGEFKRTSYRRRVEREHLVQFTRPFHIGVHEVTQQQYFEIMGRNPSAHANWGHPIPGAHKDRVEGLDTHPFPVEMVTWDEATKFCRRLSERPAEQQAGRQYRLPTEAEWEYACRAGTTSKYHFGEALDGELANAGFDVLGRTARVGSFPPNAFGLYDMHGNVAEWCSDWFDLDYYLNAPTQNPQGPSESKITIGGGRSIRGGSMLNDRYASAGERSWRPPDVRTADLGFRVVCVPK